MKRILFLFGTRPEAIKLAPLIKLFKTDSSFLVKVGVTAQHREMLDQVLVFFKIKPDYDLNIMQPNQSLENLTAVLIQKISKDILEIEPFDYVFVQGDTTTVLAGSLAAFYKKIKIVHLEAGLRSYNLQSPFPEEMNRKLVSSIADYHFCPTRTSVENLKCEGITRNVFLVGNSVIDALLEGVSTVRQLNQEKFMDKFKEIDFSKKIILVTCHRRENFGDPIKSIFRALSKIASDFNDTIQIVYPVHLNPNVKLVAEELLKNENIKLIKPLEYPDLIWLMDKSYFIITDSGGIQEEAPSLNKPVLVLRENTERIESVEVGNAILVGSDEQKVFHNAKLLITDFSVYNEMSKAGNPYGDGKTSEIVLQIIKRAGK